MLTRLYFKDFGTWTNTSSINVDLLMFEYCCDCSMWVTPEFSSILRFYKLFFNLKNLAKIYERDPEKPFVFFVFRKLTKA